MTRCAKCQGPVDEGFLLDTTYGGSVAGSWVSGAPEKSIWRGLKLSDKQRLPVQAYRCTRCGFLELYAKPA